MVSFIKSVISEVKTPESILHVAVDFVFQSTSPQKMTRSGQPLAGPNMQPELLRALSHWQPCCSQVAFVDAVSQNSYIIFRPTMQDFLADRKRTVESKR